MGHFLMQSAEVKVKKWRRTLSKQHKRTSDQRKENLTVNYSKGEAKVARRLPF